MSYMLLIVEPQGQRSTRSLQEGKDVYQRMVDYSESLRSRGVLIESNSLHRNAVRLNKQAGKATITDGPFTEAKELVGGWALMECRDLDEAVEWSKRFLGVLGEGEVRVRPVLD